LIASKIVFFEFTFSKKAVDDSCYIRSKNEKVPYKLKFLPSLLMKHWMHSNNSFSSLNYSSMFVAKKRAFFSESPYH
jgi:hypothetical protein